MALTASPTIVESETRSLFSPIRSGVNLAEVEHVVDEVGKVSRVAVDDVDIGTHFRRQTPRAYRSTGAVMRISLNPIIRFSGVRSSWLMFAANSVFS